MRKKEVLYAFYRINSCLLTEAHFIKYEVLVLNVTASKCDYQKFRFFDVQHFKKETKITTNWDTRMDQLKLMENDTTVVSLAMTY